MSGGCVPSGRRSAQNWPSSATAQMIQMSNYLMNSWQFVKKKITSHHAISTFNIEGKS